MSTMLVSWTLVTVVSRASIIAGHLWQVTLILEDTIGLYSSPYPVICFSHRVCSSIGTFFLHIHN